MRKNTKSKKFTERNEGLQTCFAEIRRYEPLTADEVVELAQQIRLGGSAGKRAKDRLVISNLRLVVSVAKEYQHLGLPLSELISEGSFGLIKAVERFDETRGFKFSTFAVLPIRQSITQAITEKGRMVRLPDSHVKVINKLYKATSEFEKVYNRKPSCQELSEITKIAEDKIRKVKAADTKSVSMDAPIEEGEDRTVADMLQRSSRYLTDYAVDYSSMSDDINLVLHTILTPREKKVICENFGIDCKEKGLGEIASELGLSHERVRQVKAKAIGKLATSPASSMLRQYLG